MLLVLALLLAGVALALGGASLLFSELVTKPPKKPLDLTPRDVGLPFEEIRFASHDGLGLVGWLIGPELAGPPILILHGYTDNKSSYLGHAQFLYEHGYPSLIYDHRGHGESAPARVSLGPLEALDVLMVMRALEENGRGERFVVWGSSMGAATALLAAAESSAIAGVISESSYEKLDEALADTLRIRHRVPRVPLVPVALFFASNRVSVDLRKVNILDAIESLGQRPLLIVSGEDDPRMPPEMGERLFSGARNGVAHIVVPEADHAECWQRGQPVYGEAVLQLIKASGVGRSPTSQKGVPSTRGSTEGNPTRSSKRSNRRFRERGT